MAQIGNLGREIIFETSDCKILNFTDFKRTVSGRWTLHEAIGAKQAAEFIGPGLDKVSFQIILDASLGVKPRDMLAVMENMVKTGQVNPLIIGGRQVGEGSYRITSISETWGAVYQRGELFQATVAITLEEYA